MKYLLVFFCLILTGALSWSQVSLTAALEQAKQALAEGDFMKASHLATTALKNDVQKTDPVYRAWTDVLIEAKISNNELDEAKRITQDFIVVLSNAYGKEDTILVSYIAALGSIHYMNGHYEEAIEAFQQSATLLEKKGSTNGQDYAELQNNIGMLYAQVGETAKAIQSLERSRSFFEKDPQAYVYELALIDNNLGDAFHNKYDYVKADQYYTRALNSFERLEDQSSPDYLNTLGNYSLLLLDRGQQEKSIALLLKNKTIAAKEIGKESPEYATVLNNLGEAYKQIGNYRLAEDYLLQSYEIKKVIYEKEHPSRMKSVNNLAMFYYTLGQLDQAELMLNELITLHQTFYPNDLGPLLLYTTNLSAVYYAQNKIAKAQKSAQDVAKLVEKKYGLSSVDYFQAFNGYSALLLEDDKSLELAYQNYIKLSALYSKIQSQLPVHDVIAYLNNKGTAAMYTNRHAEAVKDFQEGMKRVEDYYGPTHPDYFLLKSNLAYDLNLQGKVQEASAPLLECASARLKKVVDLFPSLTESEREFYNQTIRSDLSHYYVFCIKNHVAYPHLVGEMADLRLRSKSLVMRSLNQTTNKILNSNNTVLIQDYVRLIERKKELAKYSTLSKRDLGKLGIDLQTEIQQTELLEKQVAKNSEYLGLDRESKTSSWKTIAANLKANEAAIEVVRVYDDFYAQSKTLFYAFIIIKNGQTYPELVVLNNGLELEKKDFNYYRNSIQYKVENKNSYHAYWSQLANKLNGITKVYLSPDGVYHKINLNTLYHPETQNYLLDEMEIELKSSLTYAIGSTVKPSSEAFLVGHPNYYLDLKEALDKYSQGKSPQARTISSDVTVWKDLPGTKEEVGSIRSILQKEGWTVTYYTEENALENKVKALQRPRILHLATHGFFEDGGDDSLSEYSQEYFRDPMLRAGLALSGAGVQVAPHELANINYYEDGILYANEALSLNLNGTDCVVLSACETGLGEIRNQEGVYGLQRAFLIAGSKSVIMSLWSVDDMATKDLMIAFYGYYSKTKELESAFRSAMTDLHVKYKEPYYWGAFVLMKK